MIENYIDIQPQHEQYDHNDQHRAFTEKELPTSALFSFIFPSPRINLITGGCSRVCLIQFET